MSVGRIGVALTVFLAVLANNVVYLQDLALGQGYISLDSWKPYVGIALCLLVVAAGLIMLLRPVRGDV